VIHPTRIHGRVILIIVHLTVISLIIHVSISCIQSLTVTITVSRPLNWQRGHTP
jgi:hypothetical protein